MKELIYMKIDDYYYFFGNYYFCFGFLLDFLDNIFWNFPDYFLTLRNNRIFDENLFFILGWSLSIKKFILNKKYLFY